MPLTMQDYQERVVAWAEGQPNVRAVIVQGSLARSQAVGHRFSDLDIDLYLADPRPLLHSEDWLHDIGEVWVCLPLDNAELDIAPTRLTWFADGQKVDFCLNAVADLAAQAAAEELNVAYQRGYRVLVDKDGLAAQLPPSPFTNPPSPKPTPAEFDFVIREFWYEALHVAQYILSRELWVVKFRDASMKNCLLQMMAWHAQMQQGWQLNIKPVGKGMAGWVDPATWRAVQGIWSHVDPADSWRALRATLVLFGRLARATAEVLGYDYAAERYAALADYIEGLCAEDDRR